MRLSDPRRIQLDPRRMSIDPRRLSIGLSAGAAVLFVCLLCSGVLATPSDRGDTNRIEFNPVTLRSAHRAVPPTGAVLDSAFERANEVLEKALPRAIDLNRTGSTGANTFACTTCIEWKPAGRETALPPNPRGARIWRVQLLLGAAIVGRGPALVEIWFKSGEPAQLAALREAGTSDAAPACVYQLSATDTETLLDLFFLSTE